MDATTDNNLILTYAKKLLNTQVSTDMIVESLDCICHDFSFRSGAVYEIDQFEQFILMESYDQKGNPLPDCLPSHHISVPAYQALVKQRSLFTYQQEQAPAAEQVFCDIFLTDSLFLYPIIDSTDKILAFVLLMHQQAPLSKEHLATLPIILSMLIKGIEARVYEHKISFAIKSLESVLDNTGIDIYVNDFNNHDILYVNKSMAEPYGGIEKFMGHKCYKVLYPGQKEPCAFCPQKNIIDEHGDPTKVYSWDYQRPFDGSWFRVFSAAFRWVDGRLAHVVSSADITDNKKYEALVHHMANYDALTNLPNRRMLLEECEHRINNATEHENGYILFFDIDKFKFINDTYGHDAGDEFLIQLSEFFTSIPILKDAIYRNGGDEFIAIIGSELTTKDHIRELAHTIHLRFEKPWCLKKGEVYCNTSIGVACYPEDGTTAEALIHKADLCMYQAKKQGGAALCFGYELLDDPLR